MAQELLLLWRMGKSPQSLPKRFTSLLAAAAPAVANVPGHSQTFREAFGFRAMRDAGVVFMETWVRSPADHTVGGLEPLEADASDDAALGRGLHARRRHDGASARGRGPRVFGRSPDRRGLVKRFRSHVERRFCYNTNNSKVTQGQGTPCMT